MDLMQVIDEPEAIVEAIFNFYESRGFQPTRDEREKMLQPLDRDGDRAARLRCCGRKVGRGPLW